MIAPIIAMKRRITTMTRAAYLVVVEVAVFPVGYLVISIVENGIPFVKYVWRLCWCENRLYRLQ